MGNRATEQKRLKIKKAKRLFPKTYAADYIPVGRGPNRDVMSEYKERSRGLAFDQKYLDWLELVSRFRGKPPGKLEAEQAAARIKNERGTPGLALRRIAKECPDMWARVADVCPSLMNIRLEDTAARTVFMFWASARDRFILIEDNHVGRYIRASIVYADGGRAKARFVSDQVRWVEFVSSSPPIE